MTRAHAAATLPDPPTCGHAAAQLQRAPARSADTRAREREAVSIEDASSMMRSGSDASSYVDGSNLRRSSAAIRFRCARKNEGRGDGNY